MYDGRRRERPKDWRERRGNDTSEMEKLCLERQQLGEASVRKMENKRIQPMLRILYGY